MLAAPSQVRLRRGLSPAGHLPAVDPSRVRQGRDAFPAVGRARAAGPARAAHRLRWRAIKRSGPGLLPGPRAACGQPVSRVLSCRGRFTGCPFLPLPRAWAIISLGDTLPCRSSGLPGARGVRAAPRLLAGIAPAWPCSRWGLPGRQHCCRRRWSLTPPFHPDPGRARGGRFLWPCPRVSPPGCYPAPCSAERGLSSGAASARDRPADRQAVFIITVRR